MECGRQLFFLFPFLAPRGPTLPGISADLRTYRTSFLSFFIILVQKFVPIHPIFLGGSFAHSYNQPVNECLSGSIGSLTMFRSPMSTFDRLLEKSTSHLLLEPDWTSILALCDSIRAGDTPPKYAVSAIKKKFYHDNPHVQYFALQVMKYIHTDTQTYSIIHSNGIGRGFFPLRNEFREFWTFLFFHMLVLMLDIYIYTH